MKAIIVKWVGPTNTKPPRYEVYANNVKPVYYSREEWTKNAAVKDFCQALGWTGKYVEGTLDGNTDVFVPVLKGSTITVR